MLPLPWCPRDGRRVDARPTRNGDSQGLHRGPENPRPRPRPIIVTLMKPRTYKVLVIREDIRAISQRTLSQGELVIGSEQAGARQP